MAINSKKNSFIIRPFISWMLVFSFLFMLLTGVVLFVQPYGRVAYWIDWTLLGLGKDDWEGVHICMSVLFLVAIFIHIYLNWKSLIKYVKKEAGGTLKHFKKVVAAFVLVAVVIAGTLLGINPFQSILDLNEYAKSSWVTDQRAEPPFGHAELLSLNQLGKKLNFNTQDALDNLEKHNIIHPAGFKPCEISAGGLKLEINKSLLQG